MKKRVIVTGASGFIGSQLIARFSEEFNFVPVCLIKHQPEELDFQGVDCILHLAALVHQMKKVSASQYFEVNTHLTERLARAAKAAGIPQFIFFSTVKVFGEDGWFGTPDRVLTTAAPCTPCDPYGASKLAAENLLTAIQDESFVVAIVRPPLVYGPGVKGNIEALIKLVARSPFLPLNYTKNRRSIVSLSYLLSWTAHLIQTKASGVSIPQDKHPASLANISNALIVSSGRNIRSVNTPSWLIFLARALFPNFAKRLFGSLVFEAEGRNHTETSLQEEATAIYAHFVKTRGKVYRG